MVTAVCAREGDAIVEGYCSNSPTLCFPLGCISNNLLSKGGR